MSELIDRQAALEVAMRYCPDDDGSCSKAGHDIREMLDEIEALPTIKPEVTVEAICAVAEYILNSTKKFRFVKGGTVFELKTEEVQKDASG